MVELQSVSKNYGPIQAVRDVSFSIGSGEIVGLLGPNGAGKTTLMKILTGFHYPSSGTARIFGMDICKDALEIKRQIGYVPEIIPVYPDLNVIEYLEFIAEAHSLRGREKKSAILNAIEATGLDTVVYRPIIQLSKGFQQRVGLAQAILHSPELLILDEPTTGLDPNQIIEIRQLIQEIGREKTVLLSSHILQEVEAVSSRVLIMDGGRLAAQGSTESIRSGLEGNTVFRVKLRTTAAGATLTEDFLSKRVKDHDGFVELLSAVPEEGAVACEISAVAGTDGAEVFRWAVKNDFVLTELQKKSLSLEEVFQTLTSKESLSNA